MGQGSNPSFVQLISSRLVVRRLRTAMLRPSPRTGAMPRWLAIRIGSALPIGEARNFVASLHQPRAGDTRHVVSVRGEAGRLRDSHRGRCPSHQPGGPAPGGDRVYVRAGPAGARVCDGGGGAMVDPTRCPARGHRVSPGRMPGISERVASSSASASARRVSFGRAPRSRAYGRPTFSTPSSHPSGGRRHSGVHDENAREADVTESQGLPQDGRRGARLLRWPRRHGAALAAAPRRSPRGAR